MLTNDSIMTILDNTVTGVSQLWAHKLRSLLTLLGMIIGVGAVIGIVSIGEGCSVYSLMNLALLAAVTLSGSRHFRWSTKTGGGFRQLYMSH